MFNATWHILKVHHPLTSDAPTHIQQLSSSHHKLLNWGVGEKMKNIYDANSLDLRMNFVTELESSFLEAQLFAIRLSFLFPSRIISLHHMLFTSIAKEMAWAAASFPAVCTTGM